MTTLHVDSTPAHAPLRAEWGPNSINGMNLYVDDSVKATIYPRPVKKEFVVYYLCGSDKRPANFPTMEQAQRAAVTAVLAYTRAEVRALEEMEGEGK